MFCNLDKLDLRIEFVSDCPTRITDNGVARFEEVLRIAKDANIIVRAGAVRVVEPSPLLRSFKETVRFEETSRATEWHHYWVPRLSSRWIGG
jgi:hypothetical protein